jgi:hypothetical protein
MDPGFDRTDSEPMASSFALSDPDLCREKKQGGPVQKW